MCKSCIHNGICMYQEKYDSIVVNLTENASENGPFVVILKCAKHSSKKPRKKLAETE